MMLFMCHPFLPTPQNLKNRLLTQNYVVIKRLINRRSKALTTNRRKKEEYQIFVFDSSDVQQTIVLDCDSNGVNGDITQEQDVINACHSK